MSKPRVIKVTFIEPYDDSDSDSGSEYVPSQSVSSEDYSSVESSSIETDDSQYSVVESSSSLN